MTASPDRRALSPVATLPTMPRPCKQETTPRNSGPRACAQLQPRRLGCGPQRPHDDGGLQNYDTPHWGRSAEPSFTTLPPQCRQRRGEGRWAGYRLGLPVGGGFSWTVSRRAPSQGYPTATARPAKTRPEICRGVVIQPSAPADSPAPKGRRGDGGTTPSLDQQQPARINGPGPTRATGTASAADPAKARRSSQERQPARHSVRRNPGLGGPEAECEKPWSSSAESLTAN